jgi:O-antigen/teichoic acid export membrane protein
MSLPAIPTSLVTRLSGTFTSLAARNAASSFLAVAWLGLLSILTIPVYIRLLGVSEWGLVAACASLQILSNFIDVGFSQIVPRWAAQDARHPARLRQHFVLFRRLYVGLGLTLFLVLQACAGYLSHRWFQVPAERADALELAIRIVSFQLLFQFVNNLHIGLWLGLQRQVLANVRACGFGTLKHAMAMLALLSMSPQAWVYALAFACIAGLEVCVNAVSVRRMLSRGSTLEADNEVALAPLLKEVVVLSGGILVGLLASQLDRIILSRTVDVASFGIYTVVATLALAFLQLQAPVTRAYFPLLVQDIQSNGRVSGDHMKRLFGGTLLTCTLPALLACALAPLILEFWLHDPKVVSLGTVPLRLLLLAIALNSLYGLGHLSLGHSRWARPWRCYLDFHHIYTIFPRRNLVCRQPAISTPSCSTPIAYAFTHQAHAPQGSPRSRTQQTACHCLKTVP